jgi:hypothetical protein
MIAIIILVIAAGAWAVGRKKKQASEENQD